MAKRMLIDASQNDETRVVIMNGSRIEELDFETAERKQLKSNIYLARITRVEPSLQAAFVDYGGDRHGFLPFSEIHPDYYQIPVADREALIKEVTELQKKSHSEQSDFGDDDEDEKPKGRKRVRQRRGSKKSPRTETVKSRPVDAQVDEESAGDNVAAAADDQATAENETGLASPDPVTDSDIDSTSVASESVASDDQGEDESKKKPRKRAPRKRASAKSDTDSGDEKKPAPKRRRRKKADEEPEAEATAQSAAGESVEGETAAPQTDANESGDDTSDNDDGPSKTMASMVDADEDMVAVVESEEEQPVDKAEDATSEEGAEEKDAKPKRRRARTKKADKTDDDQDGEEKKKPRRRTTKKAAAKTDETLVEEGIVEEGIVEEVSADSVDAQSDEAEKEEKPKKPARRRPARKKAKAKSDDNADDAIAEADDASGQNADEGDQNLREGDDDITEDDSDTDDGDTAEARDEAENLSDGDSEEEDQQEYRAIMRSLLIKRYKIQEVIKRRQILLVQVVKEERGNKGAALTTYLSLAGRYCVLMPNTARGGGISRKIANAKDRKRLKSIVETLDIPSGISVIVRTAGSQRTKPEINRDYEYLLGTWDQIRKTTLESTAPCLVHEEGNVIKRAIRDLYSQEMKEIVIDGEKGYDAARIMMRALTPSHVKKIKLSAGESSLFVNEDIENHLEALHEQIVQLPSGGYIVLNQTEALVAIDVNSGKAIRERHIEDTAVKTNLEAAEEIGRQLKLRDLAGLVVIDFIDMEENRNNNAVERRLKDSMRNDRARIQIGRISAFGLLELSRQRIRPSVFENTRQPCKTCSGAGMVRSPEAMANSILRIVEERLRSKGLSNANEDSATTKIVISVQGDIAVALLNNKRQRLSELEDRLNINIVVQIDPALDYGGSELFIEDARHGLIPLSGSEANQGQRKSNERRGRGRRSERPERNERTETEAKPKSTRRQRGRPEEAEASEEDEEQNASKTANRKTASSGDDDSEDDGSKRRRKRGKRGGRRRRKSGDDGEQSAVSGSNDSVSDSASESEGDTKTVGDVAALDAPQPDLAPPSAKTDDSSKRAKPVADDSVAEAIASPIAAPIDMADEIEAELSLANGGDEVKAKSSKKKVVPEKVAPEEAVSEETVSEETIPEGAIAAETLPEAVIAEEVVEDTGPKRSGWWQR